MLNNGVVNTADDVVLKYVLKRISKLKLLLWIEAQ